MNANFQKFNRNDSPSIRKLRSRRIYDLAETTSSQTVDTAITTITSSNETTTSKTVDTAFTTTSSETSSFFTNHEILEDVYKTKLSKKKKKTQQKEQKAQK